MTSKMQKYFSINEEIIFDDDAQEGEDRETPAALLTALNANIKDSLEEIDILRGTVQYWESRRAATDAKERDMLREAFRIMHGELLGLTARMKDLLDRAETPSA